ncbi:MAG: hypothetical protein AVDCRST_MAG07-44 [uncultured Frankineae bacterium]|uniref:DUF4232 domain-containing protein n=1 Tax=uncultured Frankineae bacterium TaxID=437475 RepID=A0A6J4KGD7_9ACTN|nr:MAG: hypothetical protein AVDCRST_MAG07-44 [uncultured Frankineae bacterium]
MPRRAAVVALLTLALAGCGDADPAGEPGASGSAGPSASASSSATARASSSPAGTASGSPAPTGPAPSATGTDGEPGVVAPQDPLSPLPARESAAPVGQPPCRVADLSVVDADTLVLPQHVEEVFVVRTDGPDCQLEGYPTLRLLGADGAPLSVTVDRGGHGLADVRPAPVTLSRGTSVSFVVASGRDGACTEASEVDVTLPGTSSAIRTATVLSLCNDVVGVSPLQRRTDDE